MFIDQMCLRHSYTEYNTLQPLYAPLICYLRFVRAVDRDAPWLQIIKLQKLRTQYHEFKDRRQLLSQYDLFLADDRILPMLTKALGKVFLKVKKQPIPIGLERRSSLAKQIAQARKSAFLCGSHGDCWSVKLANIVMTEDQVVENLMAGLTAVVDKIPRKWKNVKAINIKTSKSIALPVYSNVGDIPPTLTSEAMEVAAPVEVTVELDGKASRNTTGKTKKTNKNTKADGSDKSDRTRKSVVNEKVRKPRPLIRQQLRRIKEETKAEKESTAPDTTNSAENGKGSRKGNRKSTDEEIRGTENNSLQVGKKRASSENAETTSAKGQREEMRKHGHDRRNEKESTKVKRKSPALTSPVARKARGGKRRKAEVE